MGFNLFPQAAKFLQEQKKHRRWTLVFLCLAMFVALGTVAALKMYGQAMTHKVRVLNCQAEVHEHTEDCYDEDDNLICGYADYMVHVHNDDCYDMNGDLACPLEEHELHEHDEDCYEEIEVLVCEEEKTDSVKGHVHTEKCYAEKESELSCGKGEHEHTEDCYTEELTCGKEEHEHSDSCYDEEGELLCDEGEHEHSGGCYESVLSCGKEEHKHSDDCYEQERELACGLEEEEDFEGHTHTSECYETEETLTCGELELHTHDESPVEKGGCYDASAFDKVTGEFIEGSLPVCGELQLEEHVHKHDCFTEVELTGEEVAALNAGAKLHIHNDSCYDEEGNLICGHEQTHIHDLNCYDGIGRLICEYGEAHVHEDSCYDEEGNLICGYRSAETYDAMKTYQGEGYTVTVMYTDEANIPEEAELIVEQITAEDDEEHYAQRKAEYQELVEDGDADMRALLKIGFYVDGEEIEPKSTVTLTIQFLDEYGLAEGAPVTIVHFGEEESEVLDSSLVENGSTTFQMDSFSEIAIGYFSDNDGKVNISQPFLYEDDSYHIVFRVEGTATAAEGEEPLPNDVTDIISEEIQPVKIAGNSASEEPSDDEDPEAPEEEAQEPSSEEDTEISDDGTQEPSDEEELEVPDVEELPAADRVQFCLEQMTEDSEEYAAYAAFTQDKEGGSQQLNLQVLKYSMTYDDIPLDLSGCKITAEIRPTQTLIEYAKKGLTEAMSSQEDEEPEGQNQELMLSALQMTDEVEVLNFLAIAEGTQSTDNTEKNNTIIVDLGNEDTLALDLTGTPNPKFSVQYYAWLDRAEVITEKPSDDSATDYLELIDTSAKANGDKAVLPTNGVTPKTAYLRIDQSSGKVKTEPKLTKIYSDRTDFEYYKQPTIDYLNAAIVNDHYELKEIWVLKDDEKADSTDKADWEIYTYSKENLHLTNRESDKEANEGSDSVYVYIKDEAVIRLVYDVTTKRDSFGAAFYDYDISNGYTTSGSVKTMDTKQAGINSTVPTTGNKGGYAFGNSNCGTVFGGIIWNENTLNAGNTRSFSKCTFGLVKGVAGLDDDKTVAFSDGVVGPAIFGTTDLTGKYQYPGTLIFNRSGDTYTLSSAEGTGNQVSASDLETFIHPTCGDTTYKHIWTNSFWPMDKIQNKDMHFGGYEQKKYQKFGSGVWDQLPLSDDGKDHNSFFGMSYAVDFELVKDYEGPLEYYFFGDDDMWVFLDDKTLVCDIGGVHSSVGQYVNLWDYLEVNKSDTPQKHTLRFFYTERGASGSTCWMQFTLPSASSLTPQTTSKDYGELRIEKAVTLVNPDKPDEPVAYDTKDEFVFEIKLTDENENNVKDDYAYTKYDADKNVLTNQLVLRDGSAFTLKNGEYIVIDHLRAGTQYTIRELDKVIEDPTGKKELVNSNYVYDTSILITDNISGENGGQTFVGTRATGTIPAGGQSQVKYTNEFRAYALPRTGNMGTAGYMRTGALLALIAVISCFGYKKRRSIRGED